MVIIDYDSHTITFPNPAFSHGASSSVPVTLSSVAAKTEGKVEEKVEDVPPKNSRKAGMGLISHQARVPQDKEKAPSTTALLSDEQERPSPVRPLSWLPHLKSAPQRFCWLLRSQRPGHPTTQSSPQ